MSDPRGYNGIASLQAGANRFNEQSFLVQSLINKMATVALVVVKEVVSGKVNIQPLVAQVDGDGNGVDHGTIYNVPYFLLQAGNAGIDLLPTVGDIGLALVCMRDSSVVKETKKAALPGSSRCYDWADAMYLGGFLNGPMTRYIQMRPTGIKIVDPTKITLDTPIVQVLQKLSVGSDVNITGKITASEGDIGGSGTIPVKLSNDTPATKLKAK